ncbi:MAPEG family protein [Marinomonas sp. GJ51-6]|uniref:MAPEG family protein n=1 Tax=Marinomonas sp. GJ51-6 TaxID=2992802 RepID=UPI00293500EA|nr:MAPEG family protein [Marinomonas sp. GJ51-6]WOD07997.1 MAPEG family protein [Marinomonas sp. GJ51-6]
MLYPMFAMVFLTFFIGLVAVRSRILSVKSGTAKVKAFKLMDGDFPETVIASTRCFNNQFEVPVLFYAACLAFIFFGQSDNSFALGLAWLFVGLRIIHAFIHITYNHILHRIVAFWSSFLVVMALWLHLLAVAHSI